MTDYIKRESVLEIVEMYRFGKHLDKDMALKAVRNGVENIQTDDVAPVVHGHWMQRVNREVRCSHCDCIIGVGNLDEVIEGEYYCPNCGAKMDKDDNE